MYARRKSDLLAEDVYVFGFSAINALPDRRLSKCLKPTLDLNSTSLSEHEDDISTNDAHDIQSLTEMCILLRDEVKTLQKTVKTHVNRISVLETQFTAAQIQLLDSKKNKHVSVRSRDQTEGEVTEQPAGADPGTREPASQPGDDQQQRPASQPQCCSFQRRHWWSPKAPLRQSWPQWVPPHQAIIPDEDTQDIDNFRHSTQQRRQILRGNLGIRAATQKRDIQAPQPEPTVSRL